MKVGALLSDTRSLFENWDETATIADNLVRFKRENLFGKASRSRVDDMLAVFRQRYLGSEQVALALVTLAKAPLAQQAFDQMLYFHTAKSDCLLYDLVAEVLAPFDQRGEAIEVQKVIQNALQRWVDEGKTSAPWREETVAHVARGAMAALRDFGVLQGAVHKRLDRPQLSVSAFAYIAFYLHQDEPSGQRLLLHRDWRLFFLATQDVERFFIEAHQRHLLEYHAAGSVIRLTFPAQTLNEYAHVISQRAH